MFTIKIIKKDCTKFIEAGSFSIVMNHEGNAVWNFQGAIGFFEIANERIAFHDDEEIQVISASGAIVEKIEPSITTE